MSSATKIKRELQKAGSYTVEKLEVITSQGVKVELLGSILHISFFEDIKSSSITGHILINDMLALSNIGPIMGQEYLRMKLKTNRKKFDNLATFDFTENLLVVNSLQVREEASSGNQILLLEFSTSELQRSQRIRINQSYKGTYSDIFVDIMRNHLNTKKKLFVEPSAGIEKIIFPHLSPFEAIHMMKRQSVSTRNNSPTYMFYEDFRGYHFRSLSSMYAQDKVETYETSVPGSKMTPTLTKEIDTVADLFSVISHEVKGVGDSIAAQRLGAYASELITYDTYTRRHETTIYNYLDNFENEIHVTKGTNKSKKHFPLISSTPVQDTRRMSDFPARRYLSPTANYVDKKSNYTTSSVLHDANGEYVYKSPRPDTWIQRRQSQLYQLDHGITCIITTNGNTSVNSGDVIEFNLPAVAAAKMRKNRKHDMFFRGRFLVHRIRQDFDFASQKHQSVMTIVKDSLETEFQSVDTTLETFPQDEGAVVTEFYTEYESSDD